MLVEHQLYLKKNRVELNSCWSWTAGVRSPAGQEIFLYFTASRAYLGPTQPPIKWVLGVKRQGSEADLSPLSSPGVKNGEAIPPIPHASSCRDA
jgi:hypothetical protein